jgi:hypothetical protein
MELRAISRHLDRIDADSSAVSSSVGTPHGVRPSPLDDAAKVLTMNSDRGSPKQPVVLMSLEDADAFRCVDIFRRTDGTYCFKEFRRDPEDGGRWTLVADYSHQGHATKEDALDAARLTIRWFAGRSNKRP